MKMETKNHRRSALLALVALAAISFATAAIGCPYVSQVELKEEPVELTPLNKNSPRYRDEIRQRRLKEIDRRKKA